MTASELRGRLDDIQAERARVCASSCACEDVIKDAIAALEAAEGLARERGQEIEAISRLLCGKDQFPGDLVQYVKNEIDGRRIAEAEGLRTLWDRLCPDHRSAVCEGGMVDGSTGCPYCHVAELQGEVQELEAENERLREAAGGLVTKWCHEAEQLQGEDYDDLATEKWSYAEQLEAALSADAAPAAENPKHGEET